MSKITNHQKYLLTKASHEAMKILNLPMLEVEFIPWQLGDNNAAICVKIDGSKTLMFSEFR